MTTTTLKGMTWDHPRGYDPLAACSALWRERTGVAVTWERRSLQDFESFPVDELARQYDLIVIDHPHVGQVTREGCLLPFDPARLAEYRQRLDALDEEASSLRVPLGFTDLVYTLREHVNLVRGMLLKREAQE